MIKRILIVGYGRAGKDTAGMMLEEITKIPYAGSTSWAAKEIVARKLGIHPQIAWEFRHQRRAQWKSILDEFRKGDETVLMRFALAGVNEEKSAGIYAGWRGIVVGVRDRKELFKAVEEDLFDTILWVERPGTPADPTVTFTREDVVNAGGEVIYNDDDLDDLRSTLFLWAEKHGLIPGLYLSGKCPTADIHRE